MHLRCPRFASVILSRISRQVSKTVVFGSNCIVLTTSFSTMLIFSESEAMLPSRLWTRAALHLSLCHKCDSSTPCYTHKQKTKHIRNNSAYTHITNILIDYNLSYKCATIARQPRASLNRASTTPRQIKKHRQLQSVINDA